MDVNKIDNKIKMPISLKFAVGILLFRMMCMLVMSTLQFMFVANPPTSGFCLGVWQGMQASLGDIAMNPAYVLGYLMGSLFLWLPILPAAFRRSRFWLITARVCAILSILSNLGLTNFLGCFADLVMVCLLFSKGAKKYVAKDNALTG